MNRYLKKISDFCQEYGMLPRGGTVMACVSGGTDSMCLLWVLRELAPVYGFTLLAAHFNHMLRGEESDGDEAFVREYCDGAGIELICGSGDVRAEAERRGKGIEETARDMRYAFFFSEAGKRGIGRVATAHNADDNLETVLMRIARGTGLRGLCGIPPVSGRLIRPLLALTRAEILKLNGQNGIPHREDSSNSSDEYTRNKLRHRVLPVLREINPSLNVTGMTELLRRDEEYLSGKAREFIEESCTEDAVPASGLASLPFPVSSRAVRGVFGEKLSEAHVEAVLELAKSPDPSGRLDLPGLAVRREYGKLTSAEASEKAFQERVLSLDRPVIMEEIGLTVSCEPAEGQRIYNSLTNFLIKRDTINSELIIRPRKTGDALKTRAGTRSVKRLMIDKKIPAHMRASLPVIACGDRVLAVYGLGQSVDTLPVGGEPAIIIKTEKRGKEEIR